MSSSLDFLRPRHTAVAAVLASLLLAACGGGGGDPAADARVAGVTPPDGGTNDGGGETGSDGGGPQAGYLAVPTTRADAFRLLTQASFGPTETTISRAMSLGAAGWVDEQLAMPARSVHLARWNAENTAVKALNPDANAGPNPVISSFYREALQANDQLRQRTAYALSQIFVVSLADLSSERAQAAASWNDMLTRNAFGNYRTLLRDVAMHPAMGLYLSHLKNRKEDPRTGRVPDQNFARELIQLFSIGLVQLNIDGTPKLDGNGRPIPTYDTPDIEGLASVFTGFSWGGPDTLNSRFNGVNRDPNRLAMPMQGYPQYHSMLAKTFLGTTVAPQGVADPNASLNAALDTIFHHPNVGPFVGRQLIQRLVTSHPSPAYVARVAAVFNNNGAGVRGDLKAVVRAVLLDEEARSAIALAAPQYGKVKEPVLRLTAFLRAFNAKSDSGKVLMTATDDPGRQLGQTPLRSPSVFNFYRPGYVPPGGEAAAAGLTLPEMQITTETTVAGYANYMMTVVQKGAGQWGVDGKGKRPDLQPNYGTLTPLVNDPAALVDQVNRQLLGENVGAALRNEQISTVSSIVIPALRPDGRNQAAVDRAKANRVWAATALTLVTPEFVVQK